MFQFPHQTGHVNHKSWVFHGVPQFWVNSVNSVWSCRQRSFQRPDGSSMMMDTVRSKAAMLSFTKILVERPRGREVGVQNQNVVNLQKSWLAERNPQLPFPKHKYRRGRLNTVYRGTGISMGSNGLYFKTFPSTWQHHIFQFGWRCWRWAADPNFGQVKQIVVLQVEILVNR